MSTSLNHQSTEELIDYEEDEQQQIEIKEKQVEDNIGRGNYVAIHSSGFRDFFLKPELLRAIGDAGFEHPSEVQHETIPHAITGVDILCQAKSGMGKTAVFVLSILQQINIDNCDDDNNANNIISNGNNNNEKNNNEKNTDNNNASSGGSSNVKNKNTNSNSVNTNNNENSIICLAIAHTRELAFQIKNEFDRFSKYMKGVKCEVVYGGINIQKNISMLKNPKTCPHILIGTPGRILALIKLKTLNLSKIHHFVLDECDKCLGNTEMRKDVQDIFTKTMKKKQVMFFSATMNKDVRSLCKKFMQQPIEVFIDDESKLTLHGLLQYYVKLNESGKNRKLSNLLDILEFNQVIIFVKSVTRADVLNKLLEDCNFPTFAIHSGLNQQERIDRYQKFKNFEKRIIVATDLFGRGIDIERVNIVINYDMPESSDAYLHRVGRAGRFGTKGLAITFASSSEDTAILNDVQARFEVHIPEMPEYVDPSLYINQ